MQLHCVFDQNSFVKAITPHLPKHQVSYSVGVPQHNYRQWTAAK